MEIAIGLPKRLRVAAIAGFALTVVGWLPAGSPARAKTKTFSSGNINRAIPDQVGTLGVEIAPSFKIERRGKVRDVNVAVRISHPDPRDLEIGASVIPAAGVLREVRLKEIGQLNQPAGADLGAGAPACKGALYTVFDSQAPTSILQGAPPFAGRFAPVEPLSAFNGAQLLGRWYLDLLDTSPGDAGVLNCWQVTIRYRSPRMPGK
jgi:hypothetical protein